MAYTHLPEPFLLFDVADPEHQRFWSRQRRDATAMQLGLATVPLLQDNSRLAINGLLGEIDHFCSRNHPGSPKEVILRQDDPQWCQARAKMVRPEFTHAIKKHWRFRPIEWDGIDSNLALSRSLHQ